MFLVPAPATPEPLEAEVPVTHFVPDFVSIFPGNFTSGQTASPLKIFTSRRNHCFSFFQFKFENNKNVFYLDLAAKLKF